MSLPSPAPRSSPYSKDRFAHIDALRAFAVLLVVFAHAGLADFVPGGSGVTIFFSISGFIITYRLLRERDKTGGFSAGGFYFRRVAKLFPPFLLVIILPTLAIALWGGIEWDAFLAQVFFVYNWQLLAQGPAGVLDGTAVVWSLAIEEQFYIVFASIWLLAVRSRHWRIITATLALVCALYSTAARLILASGSDASERIYYGSDARMDGIAWGVVAALVIHLAWERGKEHAWHMRALSNDWALIGAIAAYLISVAVRDEWFRDTLRYSVQSLAACVVILYGLLPGTGKMRRAFNWLSRLRVVSLIGLASYSIYLVHLLVMNALRDSLSLPVAVEVAVLTSTGIAAGVAIYFLVEVPVQRARGRVQKPIPPLGRMLQPGNSIRP